MVWLRDSFADIKARVLGDIASATEGRAYLKTTVERAFGLCVAGAAHLIHGHFAWLYAQLFPQTADEESLARWGDLLNVARNGGGFATGIVTFRGAEGALVPLPTVVQVHGLSFATVAEGVIGVAGDVSLTVRALQRGTASNRAAGETLALTASLTGVDADGATVDDPGFTGGTELEDFESYRDRVIERFGRALPTGQAGDYRTWALEVEGVYKAWEFPRRMGAGTVSLGFTTTDNAIPDALLVSTVQDELDLHMPLDMRAVYVAPPVPNYVTLALDVYGNVDGQDVLTALENLFAYEAELEQPIALSRISEAVSFVTGETSNAITEVTVAVGEGEPVALIEGQWTITPSTWGLLVLSTVTLTINGVVYGG